MDWVRRRIISRRLWCSHGRRYQWRFALWSPGFMPGKHAGVRFRNSGDPILNVSWPAGVDAELQRDSLDLIGALNRRRLEVEPDPEIATRIASYEMAYRLQSSAPELMDLQSESPETLAVWGSGQAPLCPCLPVGSADDRARGALREYLSLRLGCSIPMLPVTLITPAPPTEVVRRWCRI